MWCGSILGREIQIHSRPRDCERRAAVKTPLSSRETGHREGRRHAMTRKPGDLPCTGSVTQAGSGL